MKVYGIILAAGEGKRAGGHKLSKLIDGVPMLCQVVEMAKKTDLDSLILVTGAQKSFGEKVARRYSLMQVHNEDFSLGMSASIKCGVSALPQDAQGFAIILGDMPYVKSETVNQLLKKYQERASKSVILVPVYQGQRGHPPFFTMDYKKEIMSLGGDQGARSVIKRHREALYPVEVLDQGVVIDVDQ